MKKRPIAGRAIMQSVPSGSKTSSGWSQLQTLLCTMVMDVGGITRVFQSKDKDAHSAIHTYMEYCAMRWQTREGTYQLKRRRLLPDVRDPPEQGHEDVAMMDI